VCVLGAALSGKTSLAFMLSKQYDVPVISTGGLLRDAAYDNPTELGTPRIVHTPASRQPLNLALSEVGKFAREASRRAPCTIPWKKFANRIMRGVSHGATENGP
jgi:cytidylate kinase